MRSLLPCLLVAVAALWACPRAPRPANRAPAPDVTSPTGDVAGEQVGGAPAASGGCAAPGVGTPTWAHHAIGYEIFVRSFADSDGDGIGDLTGLLDRFDDLNDGVPGEGDDLEVDLIWLMPIQQSPSYHGYDVYDYDVVNREYGGDAALDALVAEARRRGVRVLVDLVVNHTSSLHPWFVSASRDAKSPFRDHYVWSPDRLDWSRPWGGGPVWHPAPTGWYYGLFWEGMPDLNFGNPAVQQAMIAIAERWLARGVAGFRLDAARYLVEDGAGPGQADTEGTHAFWRSLRAAVDRAAPESLLLGEVWAPLDVVRSYVAPAGEPELHMAFDFDGASGILDAIRSQDPAALAGPLCRRLRALPADAGVGVFLTNHDMERVATRLRGAGPAGLRLAATLLLTLPGTPWLYYGEEIGMANGGGSGDEAKRLPMRWEGGPGVGFTTGHPWRPPDATDLAGSVAGQRADPQSLWRHYQWLIRQRRAHEALRVGATRRLAVEAGDRAFGMWRGDAADGVIVVANFDDEAARVVLAGAPDGAWRDLRGGETLHVRDGRLDAGTLSPYGARLLARP